MTRTIFFLDGEGIIFFVVFFKHAKNYSKLNIFDVNMEIKDEEDVKVKLI